MATGGVDAGAAHVVQNQLKRSRFDELNITTIEKKNTYLCIYIYIFLFIYLQMLPRWAYERHGPRSSST